METYESSVTAEQLERALNKSVFSVNGKTGDVSLGASDVKAVPLPSVAEVGQTIVVTAVDKNGVPTAWEAANMPSGGHTTPTAAEKIVEYTVDATAATATAFAFTVAEYPKLAECNHLRGIVRKAVNGGMPWVQIVLNSTAIYPQTVLGKAQAGSVGMLGFEITRSGEFFQGGMTAPTSTSMYTAWSSESQFSNFAYRRLAPLQIAELTSVVVSSYQAFLDEGATIEIWGWND